MTPFHRYKALRQVFYLLLTLGLPSGASNKDLAMWNSVIERVDKRLAGYQKRYLLIGERKYSSRVHFQAFLYITCH